MKEDSKTDTVKVFCEYLGLNFPEFELMPEFGNWMLEAVPRKPYGSYANPNELLSCEASMEHR